MIDLYGRNLANNWRSCNVRGANNIPLFLDCVTLGAMPECFDETPQYDGDTVFQRGYPDMKAFCIDRHNGGINMLFMDWSARKVGLKELWTLKWHRLYDTKGPWTTAYAVNYIPDWPEWMRNFKDF